MDYSIRNKEQLIALWTEIYDAEGRPDWSHIIPYYHEDIFFKDSVQEIRGKEEFTAMTERLVKRSGSLKMSVRNVSQEGRTVFLEWVMTLRYKRYPESSINGSSRITLTESGKIIEQRDYYDLWGDIFDNIPFFRRVYRAFMRWKFG
jgi:hypothetical protein